MEHKLKILPDFFEAVESGNKTFEVRRDDRGIQTGDTLILQEWWNTEKNEGYTGRELKVAVTYVLRDTEYCKEGYCIIGIKNELDYCPFDYNMHTLRITLNYCGAVGHISFLRGGNCKGANILDTALSFFEDCDEAELARLVEDDCRLEMLEVDNEILFNVTLHKGDNEYEFEAISEDELQDMIVAIEIADCKGRIEVEEL